MQPLVIAGVVIHRVVVPHPLLGLAHELEHRGVIATAMSAIDWDRPTQIPTVAEPGKLPPGSGGAILNAIAARAVAAGVPALRYAGPYPTAALWRALARSFHTDADEAAFTADALGRALRLARDELPIEFRPAPHERRAIACGFVEWRDGPLRAVIDNAAYERGGSPARLVAIETGWAAELWFGDAAWSRVAELGEDGALVAGPWPIERVASDVVGREFPVALRAALAELVSDAVPAVLAADARSAIADRPIVWADLGARTARARPERGGFEVHAALWVRIAPLGLARLALAIAEALAPIVASALVAEITAPA